jgi:hypothetical protein
VIIASIVGVGLPAYLATDMIHQHTWLQAAGASCLALFMGFIVFWSAAMVSTAGPSGVRVGAVPVVISVRFDPTTWQTDISARLAMVQDLCQSHRLEGLHPEEVRAQLGEPIKIIGPGVSEMCYALIPTAQPQADAKAEAKATFLRVLFSSQGHVASVALGSN